MVRFHPLDRHSFMCVLVGQSNSFAHISSYSIFAAFTLRVSYHPFFRYRFSHPFCYILRMRTWNIFTILWLHLNDMLAWNIQRFCVHLCNSNSTQIKRPVLLFNHSYKVDFLFEIWYWVCKLILPLCYQVSICKKRCTKI